MRQNKQNKQMKTHEAQAKNVINITDMHMYKLLTYTFSHIWLSEAYALL